MAAPSSWVKESAVESLPRDTTWRRPDESVGDGRMLSGLAGTAAGLCFFCRNSSLRLAFLLMVDGRDVRGGAFSSGAGREAENPWGGVGQKNA